MLVLRQQRIAKIVLITLPLCLPLVIVASYLDDEGASGWNLIGILILVSPVSALMIVLAFRVRRIRVECRPHEITVYNMWGTVRIPPAWVNDVEAFTAEIWWHPAGRPQCITKVTAFRSNHQTLMSVRKYNEQRMTDLKTWLEVNHPRQPL